MKLINYAVYLLLATAPTTAIAGLFEAGITLGANLTTPTSVPSGFVTTNGIGFVVGGYAQVGLGDLLAIGTEVTYAQRGFEVKSSADSLLSFDGTTSSINIPLILKIGLPLGFNIDVGYQFSQFLRKPREFNVDFQTFGLLGIEWHPLDDWRIGARFQPGFSAFNVNSASDVASNVGQVYVSYVLF